MAKFLGWEGPPRGKGSVEDVVAHTKIVRKALEDTAKQIHRRAKSNLELAPKERTGAARVSILGSPPSLLDWYVFLEDDPGAGGPGGGRYYARRSALSIENGHWFYPEHRDSNGRFKSGRATGERVWIPGLHILGNAIDYVDGKGNFYRE